jgi:sodium-dependent dicarboxylate transporter 2/3/5
MKNKFILMVLPVILALLSLVLNISDTLTITIFMTAWMVLWWIFEVMPLGMTAIIPMFYLPMTGVMELKTVAPHYSNPIIYLFLGGFIIARGLEKTLLSERIALLLLKITGKSDRGIILGFTIATGALSMWISNTATTVMMVPIAMSVMTFLEQHSKETDPKEFVAMSTVLFLTLAYSANIGGIMTPIGSPPNVVFLGYLDSMFKMKIDFYKWVLIAAPSAIILLALMLLILNRIFPYKVAIDQKFRDFIADRLKSLGQMKNDQKIALVVFILTAVLWITKDFINSLIGKELFDDTTIAMFGGFLLFLIPHDFKRMKPVLDQKDISYLPWDIVLLFGGGMALAAALKQAGIIESVTHYFATLNVGAGWGVVFMMALVTLFLTEVMSNVALCVVALPVIMKFGEVNGISPFIIGFPAAICSSFAFTMPISTPPNAIVFGTHRVTVKDMMRAGIWLNIISVIVVMTVSWTLMNWLVK